MIFCLSGPLIVIFICLYCQYFFSDGNGMHVIGPECHNT